MRPDPARESAAAARAFQSQLALMGGRVALKAAADYVWVPGRVDLSSSWLVRALRSLMRSRAETRSLAVAYYRYVRALHVGATVRTPGGGSEATTLGDLRSDFWSAVDDSVTVEDGDYRTPGLPDADLVQVNADDVFTAGDDAGEAAAQAEAERALRTLGISSPTRKYREQVAPVGQGLTQSAVTEGEIRASASARQARAAARIAMDGGRGELFKAIDRDKRALGWARVSDGNPCHFCAMLLARGAVYKSERDALYSDGDKYHDGCQCSAVCIFDRKQYESSVFDENRAYRKMWSERISGKFGVEEARRQWRHLYTKLAAQEGPKDG